jgi:hypothetical protein
MGILDVHADELLQASRATPFIAPPRPTPKFSAWGISTAVPRGAAAGAAETTGFWADIVGAFGQVIAATDPLIEATAPRDVRERLAQGQKEAEQRLRNEGVDFSSEAGDLFRGVGRSYRPDPATAHAAEDVVFGFTRFASKAVGYSVAGGPVVGAALTGADEALQTADDLRLQGVDLATRTKAGALAGVAAGAGVVLPVAGKTLAQTAGLVALGGPLSFSGQQAATRYILDNAGYEKLASQYDPFDPVGLAVSTLVPAGFGAWGLRGARRRAATQEPIGETKPGQSEPKPPETAPEVAARETMVRAEHVDAARVALIRETVDSWNLARPDDARAAAAHLEAFARAQDQLAAGQRVAVSDIVPAERIAVSRALDQMITGLQSARDDFVAAAADLADPGAVRLMREELASLEGRRPDVSDAAIREAVKQIQAAEGVSYKAALSEAKKQAAEQAADFGARISRIEDAIERNAEAQRASQELRQLDRQIEAMQAERQQIDAPSGAAETDIALAARQLVDQVAEGIETLTGLPARDVAPEIGRAMGLEPEVAPAAAAHPSPAEPAAPAARGGQPGHGEVASLDARLAAVEQQLPELQVMVDGMERPVPLREFLERVRAEAAEEAADAPLYQVAAQCALLNGV